ncbi:sensor histidine kinase [Chitinophaga skermanii]|nr:7TM diverse intracellular signaling domain-containing protein [Chitinophaga skermanii]
MLLLAIIIPVKTYSQTAPSFFVLEDTSRNLTATQAWAAYKSGQFKPLPGAFINPGFTSSDYWVVLQMPGITASNDSVLVVDNAHINELLWYSVQHDSLILQSTTGDFHPFSQRPIIHNTFAFPLQPATGLYLLKIDKHFESLQAPMFLVSRETLATQAAQEALVNGLLTGILLLIVLFGVFLFITTKDKVYGWYAIYVCIMMLWILSNKGIGFRYLWPNSEFFPSRSRAVFAIFNIIFSIQFLQSFLQQSRSSKFFKPLKVLQFASIAVVLVMLAPIDYTAFGMYSSYVQRSMSVFTLIMVVLAMGSLIERIIQGYKPALFYLVANVVLLVFATMESLYHLGKVSLPFLLAHFGVFIGCVIEMVIIMFGLTTRFNSYRRERENLLVQMNEQQKALTETIITVQEKERKELADQLHDEIGSMLSLASLNLSAVQESKQLNVLEKNEKLVSTAGIVQQITKTIRNISHQLTPVAIEKYGFKHAVEDWVMMANASGKINIELVIVGFEKHQYSTNFQHTIYRIIQELLQNIFKHAAAENVILQLIEHEDLITIMVEDNGVGIDQTQRKQSGPGFLRSIYAKVNYLQGTMEAESSEGQGTLINIEIPIHHS